jgi:hypothetical protein
VRGDRDDERDEGDERRADRERRAQHQPAAAQRRARRQAGVEGRVEPRHDVRRRGLRADGAQRALDALDLGRGGVVGRDVGASGVHASASSY